MHSLHMAVQRTTNGSKMHDGQFRHERSDHDTLMPSGYAGQVESTALPGKGPRSQIELETCAGAG
jgi:hypothetical protein